MSLLPKGEKVPVPSDPMQESISKCIREEQACSRLPSSTEAQFHVIMEREKAQRREAMALVQGLEHVQGLVQGLEGQVVVDDSTSDSLVELRMNKCKRISKKKLQKIKRKQRTVAN
nr:hypothetical protein [Tanacetum cinerariifolium]